MIKMFVANFNFKVNSYSNSVHIYNSSQRRFNDFAKVFLDNLEGKMCNNYCGLSKSVICSP